MNTYTIKLIDTAPRMSFSVVTNFEIVDSAPPHSKDDF